MKKSVTWHFLFWFLTSPAWSQSLEALSPEAFMHYYVKSFNEENATALQEIYHFPCVRISSGKLSFIDDRSHPVIDFGALKKAGWKYSQINAVKVLDESKHAALVELHFTRFDAHDQAILSQTSFYTLTKNAGHWQIIGVQSVGR